MDDLKLITFDLDDTLWPCRGVIEKAEAAVYQWLQQNYPAITDSYDVDAFHQRRITHYKENRHLGHDVSAMRKDAFRAVAREHDYSETLAEDAFGVFMDYRNRVTPYDDVATALETLSRHYRLAALTNGNSDPHKIGMGHFFEFCLNAADAGAMKPHPAIFELALSKSGVDAEQTLHVGDNPLDDVHGAQQLGIHTVWVNRYDKAWPDEVPKARLDVASIQALVELLITNAAVE